MATYTYKHLAAGSVDLAHQTLTKLSTVHAGMYPNSYRIAALTVGAKYWAEPMSEKAVVSHGQTLHKSSA